MTCVVTWALPVLQEIQRLEAAADDPTRIRRAVDWVDYTLRRTPTDMGESRSSERVRLWYGDVLGVYYHVDRDALTVRVQAVAAAKRR